MERVYIVKGKEPYKATQELLDKMKFSLRNKKVFIKTNVHPAKLPSTDVRVIKAIVSRLSNCEILVGGNVGIMGKSFRINNYYDLIDYGVKLVDIDLQKKVYRKVKRPIRFEKIPIADCCFDCDYFINVSKLKIHNHAGVTMSLKNLFGCIPGTDKMLMHPHIDDAIHDYMQILKPNLNIVDGIVGGQNDEFYVIPKRSNIMIGGKDALSVDVVATRCMGVDPKEIEYLRLLNYKEDEIKVLGESISDVMKKYDRRIRPVRKIRNFMELGLRFMIKLNLISR
ncbi:MAG: DUF362 domain-containing protein [Candidatus Aenigmarchaeota archaeon]|nr:DUF362 domain-containing protein [Candidatus Aenigmarchaeota archaeon]